MSLAQQIAESLIQLKGYSSVSPRTATWRDERGLELSADFTAVDTLGCACRELRAAATSLNDAGFAAAAAWGEALSQRVTYLLERIGPLELDSAAQTVLVRSVPPTRLADKTSYYEIQIQAPGRLSLRRYERAPGTESRRQVDIHLTHEVLQRLACDIVETLPAGS
jgi:hypothetical protein